MASSTQITDCLIENCTFKMLLCCNTNVDVVIVYVKLTILKQVEYFVTVNEEKYSVKTM